MTLDYRDSIKRDNAGWPEALSQDERDALCELMAEILDESLHPVPLGLMKDIACNRTRGDRDRFPMFSRACLQDFLFTCVERALRAVSETVYIKRNPARWSGESAADWTRASVD